MYISGPRAWGFWRNLPAVHGLGDHCSAPCSPGGPYHRHCLRPESTEEEPDLLYQPSQHQRQRDHQHCLLWQGKTSNLPCIKAPKNKPLVVYLNESVNIAQLGIFLYVILLMKVKLMNHVRYKLEYEDSFFRQALWQRMDWTYKVLFLYTMAGKTGAVYTVDSRNIQLQYFSWFYGKYFKGILYND